MSQARGGPLDAALERPRRRRGRPVVPFNVEGEIVTFGLGQNPNNPYAHIYDAQRHEALVEVLAEIILRQRGVARAKSDGEPSPP